MGTVRTLIVLLTTLSCAAACVVQDLEHLGDWHFRYSATNGGVAPVTLMKRHTPLDGEHDPHLFRVVHVAESGHRTPVLYGGIKAKRLVPGPDEYVVLAPGERVSRTLDLSHTHEFIGGQQYDVHLTTTPCGVQNDAHSDAHQRYANHRVAVSPSHTHPPTRIIVSRDSPAAKTDSTPPQSPARRQLLQASYASVGCAAWQISANDKAVSIAYASAITRETYFLDDRCRDEQYTRVFGTSSRDAHYAEVKDTVLRIHESLERGLFTLHCGGAQCDERPGTVAYTVTRISDGIIHDDRNIHLCDGYWDFAAGLTYDSQPGTIVHELSHHFYVGATADFVYGREAVFGLAQRDPGTAVNNADSYEVFYEQGYATCGKWAVDAVPQVLDVRLPSGSVFRLQQSGASHSHRCSATVISALALMCMVSYFALL